MRQLGGRCRRLRLDVHVETLFRRQFVVALGGLLEFRERGHLRGAAGGFGFRAQGFLLRAAPAADARETGADFLGLGGEVVGGCGGGAGAERDEIRTLVLFAEAVLQAVVPVTVGAVDAGVLEGVDKRLAFRFRALRCGEDGRFLCAWEGRGGCCADAVFAPVFRPLAGVGALVGRLGAVVEAVGVVAGVAAEGQEVELVAVGELAVGADRLEVVVVHFGEGLFGRRGVVGGGLGGHGVVRNWRPIYRLD